MCEIRKSLYENWKPLYKNKQSPIENEKLTYENRKSPLIREWESSIEKKSDERSSHYISRFAIREYSQPSLRRAGNLRDRLRGVLLIEGRDNVTPVILR